MLLDQNIVAVSESAVFRTLREADLLNRWKRSTQSPGVYNFKQQAPSHAFCRYIVHHRLLTELSGTAVSVELETALASSTRAKPRIADDHGSEFRNAELRAVIKAHDRIDIRTRTRHPESNGIVDALERHRAKRERG